MSYEYDFLVYIGRFQPLHLGHQSVIDAALEKAHKVIVLIGSANMPSTPKNPFYYEERVEMVKKVYPFETGTNRLITAPLDDIMYDDDRWLAQVQSTLTNLILDEGNNGGIHLDGMNDMKIGIIGYEKDDSSYYLSLFPQWDKVGVPQWGTISATELRENFLQRAPILPHDLCDERVVDWMKTYMLTDQFRYLVEEREGLQKNYFDKWKDAPYPPHFVTADAVVTQAGHILLVTRAEAPGKGLLALPGGHIDARAGGAFENCLKELWEEARPKDQHSKRGRAMPENKIRGFYTGAERRFDQPGRDPRGFYSTTAFRFVFPGGKLWDVEGGLSIDGETNDVSKAAWYPIGSLDSKMMFSDHYFIIQQMLDEKRGR